MSEAYRYELASVGITASTADPMDIPRALLQIIETPAGSRGLRYRVAPGASGVDAINALSAQVQEQFLSTFVRLRACPVDEVPEARRLIVSARAFDDR